MIGTPIEYHDFVSKSHFHDKPEFVNEICPTIYYATPNSLKQEVFNHYNFKIIINCLPTQGFLNILNESDINISTDITILSLDLNFDMDKFNPDERVLLNEFHKTYNKVLQNYLNHFITYNPAYLDLSNKLPENTTLQLSAPILTGNIKNNLFKLIRFITLFRIIDESIDVLIIGEANENVSKSLIVAYLMDTYNYNLSASLNYLSYKINFKFNLNYYNDLLLVENLKEFYHENIEIKRGSEVLYNNKLGKRSRDDATIGKKRIRI